MAGGRRALQKSLIGVGSALRKARVHRGVTIDEASRGTKIRPEYLEALEREEFDALLGEVYVRGALRSYAAYLGVDPDKVLHAYASADGVPGPQAPEPPGQIRKEIGEARRRDNHRLAILVVAIVVILAAGFGLLSSRNSTPEPADLPTTTGPTDAAFASVLVAVEAVKDLRLTVVVDGGVQDTVELQEGGGATFVGNELIILRLPGGRADLSVNGESRGIVGERGEPFEGSFAPTSEVAPTTSGNAAEGAPGTTSTP